MADVGNHLFNNSSFCVNKNNSPQNVNPTLNLHSTFAKSIVFQFFIPIIYADKAVSGVDEI